MTAGVPVFFLAADEDRALVLVRIGQMIGISRDALDSDTPDPEAVEKLAAHLASLPFECMDPDEPSTTVEAAAAELRRRYPKGSAVLVIDSLQRARCEATFTCESEMTRAEAMMMAIKSVSAMGITPIALSELNRSSYASNDPRARTAGMAAGKHSGAIEYIARVLVNVERGKDDIIKMTVEKPTGHNDKPIALRFDAASASFTETTAEHAADPDPLDELLANARRVDGALRRTNLKGLDGVRAGAGMSKTRAANALRFLIEKAVVFKNSEGFYQHTMAPFPDVAPGNRSPQD